MSDKFAIDADEIEMLNKVCHRLATALSFYANRDSYHNYGGTTLSAVSLDDGKIAREAMDNRSASIRFCDEE